ncbi:MAG: HPr family phosphocarrier protein [Victivallales bacterium]|nr:HPr family phosphocarrier protein [Victivallales bacterium]
MEQAKAPNIFKAVVTVLNKRGLHMRLAGELVTVSSGFNSEIMISKGRRSANAKSVLDLVSLSAAPGTHLNVSTKGTDAKAAIDAITNFFGNYIGDK